MTTMSDAKRKRVGREFIAVAMIVALLVGYIPFVNMFFRKELNIYYQIAFGDQYESPGGFTTPSRLSDVIFLDEKGSFMLSGVVLEKRYTELVLPAQGFTPQSLELTAEFSGEPGSLWVHAGGIGSSNMPPALLYLAEPPESGWRSTEEGEFSLFQKDDRLANIAEFVSSAEDYGQTVGLSGIDPGGLLSYALRDEAPGERNILGMPIRGSHTLGLIVNRDTLRIRVFKRDLNRYAGTDQAMVYVERDGKPLYESVLQDDGIGYALGIQSRWRQAADISLKDLKPGLYMLKIVSASSKDDFVIEEIRTDAVKASFAGSIFLYDPQDPLKTSSLFLSSPGGVLEAETWHPAIRRKISGSEVELLLPESEDKNQKIQKSSAGIGPGRKQLHIENPGSLILKSPQGGFAFSTGDLFNPYFPQYKPNTASSLQEVSVILAKGYSPPQTSGMVKRSSCRLLLEGIAIPGGKLNLVLEKTGDVEIVLTSLRIVLR